MHTRSTLLAAALSVVIAGTAQAKVHNDPGALAGAAVLGGALGFLGGGYAGQGQGYGYGGGYSYGPSYYQPPPPVYYQPSPPVYYAPPPPVYYPPPGYVLVPPPGYYGPRY